MVKEALLINDSFIQNLSNLISISKSNLKILDTLLQFKVGNCTSIVLYLLKFEN